LIICGHVGAGRLDYPQPVFLGLFALFAGMTAILFWQWLPQLHSALIGQPEDNMQDFWNTWYASVANGFFFTKLIKFPEGTPLYYQSFAYPKVFAIALLSRAIGTEPSSLLFLQPDSRSQCAMVLA
jgi:hypothetical protein